MDKVSHSLSFRATRDHNQHEIDNSFVGVIMPRDSTQTGNMINTSLNE